MKEKDTIVFSYELDDGSIQRVVQSTQKVEQVTDSVKQSVAELDATARNAKGVAQMSNTAEQGQSKWRGWIDQIKQATREMLGFDAASKSAAQSSGKIQPPAGGGVLNSVRGTIGQAGGLLGVAGGSQLGGAVSSTLALTDAMGVYGFAAGAAVAVTQALAAETNRIATETKRRLDIEQEVAQKVAQATTTGLIALRDEAQQALDAANERKEKLKSTPIALTPDLLLGVATQNLPGGGLGGGEYKAVREEIAEAEAAAIAAQTALDAYNQAIADNAGQSNDAAAALEKRSQQDIKWYEDVREAEQLSSEERQKRIDSMQREVDDYQKLLDSGRLSSAATSDVIDAMGGLNDTMRAFKSVTGEVADALEAAEEASKRTTDAATKLLDAQTNLVNAQEKAAAFERETSEKQAAHDRTVQQARDDAKKQQDALDTQDRQDRSDAEADDKRERQKALKEHLQKLEDINHTFEQSSQNAIADRDAAAFDAAKQQRDDALSNEQRSYKDRLDALDDALEKQYQTIDRRYNEQSQRIQAAMDDAIARENERWDAERAQRATAYQQLLTDEKNYLDQVKALQLAYWASLIAAAEALQTPSPNATSGGGLPTWIGPVVGGDGGMPDGWVPFPDPTVPQGGWGGGGGYTPGGTGGLMYTRPGLLPGPSPSTNDTPVLPFMVRRGSYGGTIGGSTLTNNMGGISFQIKGLTRRQMKQEVLTVLDQMADQVGIP